MQYRKDLKSENKLSILGFGCMRFPRGISMKPDLEKAEKLICAAVEQGVNYFDTAYSYGGSEVALGEALHKNNLRDKVFIATKLPYQTCKSSEDFDRIFKEHLERLKTDHIDYYLIHNLSTQDAWERLLPLGIEQWIVDKKAEGAIGQIGFSFHGSQQDFIDLLDVYDWDFCQIQYNYMDENYQAGRAGMLKAYERNLTVIVMEPLLGGKLATGLPNAATQLLTKADNSRSAAAWALQWLWNQPEVTVVLSGMNSLEQLEDNVKTAADAEVGMLSKEESATLAKVVDVFRSAYKVDCTACNYCMPCPQKIDIPSCFAAYNARYVTGLVAGISMYATILVGKNIGASACVKCGACEKLCPQHIPIMQEMEAVKKTLEPLWIRLALKAYFKFM